MMDLQPIRNGFATTLMAAPPARPGPIQDPSGIPGSPPGTRLRNRAMPAAAGDPQSATRESADRLQPGLAAGAAAALFAGLLVVSDALDVLREPFLLARLLEPPEHLFGGFVPAGLYLNHRQVILSRTSR